MAALPPFPSFDITDHVTLGPNWEKWLSRFKNFLVALDIDTDERKTALLLHYAGESVFDVYDTLKADGDKYDDIVRKLTEHFKPVKRTQYRVYDFREAEQLPNETLDAYVTRLRGLARDCAFNDIDNEIKMQITQKCRRTKVRCKSLEDGVTLKQVMDYACGLEISEQETHIIEKQVNRLHVTKPPHATKPHITKPHITKSSYSKPKNTICGLCGGVYPHKGSCPAAGQQCYICQGMNHFSRMCRSKFSQSQQQKHGTRPKQRYHPPSKHPQSVNSIHKSKMNINNWNIF